jgi:hypothetical protein
VDDGGGTAELRRALRAVATPDLYRKNSFRLAGRTVDATPARWSGRPPTSAAAGATPPSVAPGPQRWPVGAPRPLGPPPETFGPEIGALREKWSLHGLLSGLDAAGSPAGEVPRRPDTPVPRTVEEFFWCWPSAGAGTDAALAAFAAGDMERADALWEAAGTDVAHHNLAVLNHMLALDADHTVRIQADRWRRSYRYWLTIWRSDAFWDLFARRVAQVGHPDLGPSTAATVRDELPLLLARIGAQVALRWAERRQSDDMVRAHWQLVEYDGFPDDVRAAARRAGASSVVARIRSLVEDANRRVRELPENVAPVARALNDQVGPALRTLGLGGAENLSAVRDAVAEQLLRYTVIYDRQTDDWTEGLRLLRLADTHAVGSDVGRRISNLERDLKRRRDEQQRRMGPGVRVLNLATYHRRLPDLGDLEFPRDL